MYSLVDISKKYSKHIIFSDVNINFKESNLYILQGVNGSGKTTLLKLIAGIIYKTEGSITLGNKISFLPDKFTFPKLMKVKSYLKEILKDNTLINKEMEKYKLENKRIKELSKGNKLKLGILQIMNNDSDIYLFDEPLDGLDDYAKHLFKDLIKEKLSLNKIVIISLHNKSFFNDIQSIVLEFKDGKINEKKKKN